MNTPTIDMPKAEARRKLQAVRTAIHRKADAEYQQLEKAYKELANGRPLLNLVEAFEVAPIDDKGRPRMAIARADEAQVRFRYSRWNHVVIFDSRFGWGQRSAIRTVTRVTVRGLADEVPDGFALVPLVPPEVKRHHDLGKCHVLWEVEQWAEHAMGTQADRDPLLLRMVGGDLWAVLGEWELTEVERAVMMGRRDR